MPRPNLTGISATTHASAVLIEEARVKEAREKAAKLRALREAAESRGEIKPKKRAHVDIEDEDDEDV